MMLCACDAVLPCAQYVQPTSFDLVILFLFWPCADYLALDMFGILYYRTFKFCVSALHILCICAYCILHIAYGTGILYTVYCILYTASCTYM